MTFNPALNTSVQAMLAHSQAMGQISENVANTNTTAFKGLDTTFSTILSTVVKSGGPGGQVRGFSAQADFERLVDRQGSIEPTRRKLDVALNGRGFFILNTAADGSGETLYTRDGRFTERLVPDPNGAPPQAFLATTQGLFVQGFTANDDGTFADDLGPVRVRGLEQDAGNPTSTITLTGNLPADQARSNFGVGIYDNTPTAQTLTIGLQQVPGERGLWDVSFDVARGTVTSGTTQLQFSGSGELIAPLDGEIALDVAWDDGTTSSIDLDLGGLTQFAGPRLIDSVEQDGAAPGQLFDTFWDDDGVLYGQFTNGSSRPLFRLGFADFHNSNDLRAESGNLFSQTTQAGQRTLLNLQEEAPNTSLNAGALERANVDLADQFTDMIKTQKAYSSAATAFQTGDEMVQRARDLKA